MGQSLWPAGALPFEASALEAYQPEQVRQAIDALLADAPLRERCRTFQVRLEGQPSAEAAVAALAALGKSPS